MSVATIINWLVDVERQDRAVYMTDEAVDAILDLIQTDLVDAEGLDPWAALEAYEAKRDVLSSGEEALVDIARSIWRGAGGASIAVLGLLDLDRRKRVLAVLVGHYLGALG